MNKKEINLLINNLSYKDKDKYTKKFKSIDDRWNKLKEEEEKLILALKEDNITKIIKDKQEVPNER